MWEKIVIAVTALLGQGLSEEWKKLPPSPVQETVIIGDGAAFHISLADGRELGLMSFSGEIFYKAKDEFGLHTGMVHFSEQKKARRILNQVMTYLLAC